jgi:hypothetical protein
MNDFEPAIIDLFVIIYHADEIAASGRYSSIQRKGPALAWLEYVFEAGADLLLTILDRLPRSIRGVVVNDDDSDIETRWDLSRLETVESALEPSMPIVGRYYNIQREC